ncbi:MAG: hypothetical protein C4527_23990 [Candidatus Omnitrophota bacterium]|jgi:tetratricopeptide (TPR) repeat protein|nr:MAG: hypothetical protein C4527_23990 [Candidatus Omnitrophota bacterium]
MQIIRLKVRQTMRNQKRNNLFSAIFLLILILVGCAQNTPDAVFNRGLRAWEAGDFIGASLYFDKFIHDFPDDERCLQAYDRLAQCYVNMKEFGSALVVFQDVKKHTDNPMIALNCDFRIGEMYAQEGNMIQAVSQFESIGNATDNPRIRAGVASWLAKIYAQQTQAASAIAQYQTMYDIADKQIDDPTESFSLKQVALTGEANIHLASQEFENARDAYLHMLDMVNNATGIVGLEQDKQDAVINWAHTWALAGDYISSATIYDQLHGNPNIMDAVKPWLVVWKIQSLRRLFIEDDDDEFTPEEIHALVHENSRLITDFPKSEQAINARVEIAQLIKDTTPEESEKHLQEAVQLYQKFIDEPLSPRRPMFAYLQIAEAYVRLDQLEKAKQTLQKLQQAFSNDPDAMQRSAYLLSLIRQKEMEKLKQQEQAAAESTPAPSAENQ